MGNVVTISRPLLEAILAHARHDPDREQCGLLLGHGAVITSHRAAQNIAASPDRAFELDPAALFAAHRAARAAGPAVLGHYHTHPVGSAQPSPRDAAAAAADGQLWLVITATDFSLWRAEAHGPLHAAFAPVDLQVDERAKGLPPTDPRQ